jgi:hypothetical protein
MSFLFFFKLGGQSITREKELLVVFLLLLLLLLLFSRSALGDKVKVVWEVGQLAVAGHHCCSLGLAGALWLAVGVSGAVDTQLFLLNFNKFKSREKLLFLKLGVFVNGNN